MSIDSTDAELMQRHLACPKCKGDLRIDGVGYSCTACGSQDEIRDRVFPAIPASQQHSFDDTFNLVELSNEAPEIWSMCYEQQSRLAAESIQTGDVVVDVGCGSKVHFEKMSGAVVIGVDPSFQSLRANTALDLRVQGGAESMPLRDRSVDRMFFFYSIHHMIGKTTNDNFANLAAALRESGRVVRKGGSITVFDMNPWWFAWLAQKLAWNRARTVLADKLNMFFWRQSVLEDIAAGAFTAKTFEHHTFDVSPLHTFAPVFSIPRLKVPKFMFPFNVQMYKWTF